MADLPLFLKKRLAEGDGRGESPTILTVSALQSALRGTLEGKFPQIHVVGEISNLTIHGMSGHAYFVLKDDKSQLRCVMWRDVVQRLGYRPRDGLRAVARGKVTVYERGGQLQLSVSALRPEGEGAALEALRRLAEQLRREGLTDPARKKPIPPMPRVLGVVTSREGAALRDVLKTVLRRNPGQHLVLAAASVQGPSAEREIIEALRRLDAHGVDTILLVRGGGSVEDLAAFNLESVARCVASLETPIITGVGHETDSTIVDLVSDLAASTPTAAAEHAVLVEAAVRERLGALTARLRRAHAARLQAERRRLAELQFGLKDPRTSLRQRAQRTDELYARLRRAHAARLREEQTRLRALEARLDSIELPRRLALHAGEIGLVEERLRHALLAQVARSRHQLALGAARLESASPLAILARGFAVVEDSSGQLLRDASRVRAGDRIGVRLARGRLDAQVLSASGDEERESRR